MTSDEDLVVDALSGEERAFDELVVRYRERLFRFLVARSASRAAAEDALQDTFVNAYRYLGSFDSRWRFSTWLYRIGIRCALRQSRFESKVQTVSVDEWEDHDSDPLAESIAQTSRDNLWLTAKRTLSADAYTALWLRYAEDMSIKEVASATGRNATWVKVTLMRARRRLEPVLAASRQTTGEGEVYG